MEKKQLSVAKMIFSFVLLMTIVLYPSADSRIFPDTSALAAGENTTTQGGNAMPYADWIQQEIDFGYHSFYYSPWRAYMDTWDANRWRETLGIVFNVNPNEADATAQLLSEAGFGTARVEINWGNFSYDDPSKLEPAREQQFTTILQALKKYNIRPLILLNANSGNPVPTKGWKVQLVKAAAKDSTEIQVDKTEGIVPGYTGLKGMDYQTMYPVITRCDAATGVCKLSAPLPKNISAGTIELNKLIVQPLSGTAFADGTPNPAAQETLDGWLAYVKNTSAFVKRIMNTGNTADAGFDLEVWNELTFGSQFLDINNYYSPKLEFSKSYTYKQGDREITGPEVLLPHTAALVADPKNNFPGVKVINGFSNQRPWDNGVEQWQGQSGFSRHYYTGYMDNNSMINSQSYAKRDDPSLNALGQIDGNLKSGSSNKIVPGTNYVPSHIASFPEYWFSGYKTENVVRDLQPFPNSFPMHFRYANPGNGKQAEVWMTEGNFDRQGWSRSIQSLGISTTNPGYAALMHSMGAKTTLRSFTFFGHKGVRTYTIYAAKGGDGSLGVIPEAFFTALAESNYVLTSSVRAKAGAQLAAVANVTKLMKPGADIENPRPLKVEEWTQKNPKVVLKGNGTKEHPDVYMSQDFAVLPYQLAANKFAVSYYVVTRDVAQVWDTTKNVTDPARYALPPQAFALTLSNVNGKGAKVQSYDPITGITSGLGVVKSTDTTITVQVDAVDYPRFLIIEEAADGPVISTPVLRKNANGTAELTFVSNVDGTARITWGTYPFRQKGTFKEEYYQDAAFQKKVYEQRIPSISYNKNLPAKTGTYRWTGTIVPQFSEKYTFLAYSGSCDNDLTINGQNIINPCAELLRGEADLKAGEAYDLNHKYVPRYNSAQTAMLYWGSESQPKQLVAPASSQGKTVTVKKNEKVTVTIPDLLVGEGIKISLEAKGLTTRFPRWDYDVRGVLWP
ncbi:MAG: hypothetical protein K0Q90_2245 [Paenibacillaceae bacterium]|nr:hypothetical protein [Paenibacillaceae bacterium]